MHSLSTRLRGVIAVTRQSLLWPLRSAPTDREAPVRYPDRPRMCPATPRGSQYSSPKTARCGIAEAVPRRPGTGVSMNRKEGNRRWETPSSYCAPPLYAHTTSRIGQRRRPQQQSQVVRFPAGRPTRIRGLRCSNSRTAYKENAALRHTRVSCRWTPARFPQHAISQRSPRPCNRFDPQ